MKFKHLIREMNLQEGVYDKGIFKAFFLAGGPGSGKTFVTSQAFAGTGLRVINSDKAFERQMQKAGLSLKMPESETEVRDMVRARAKATTKNMLDLSLDGRLGIIIDGTGDDYAKITKLRASFEHLGYDTYMIFVNTSLDVALERNAQRERSVQEHITIQSWKGCQANIGAFQNLFGGGNFIVVDNSVSAKELVTVTMNKCSKFVTRLMTNPIKNYTAKKWVAHELELRKNKAKMGDALRHLKTGNYGK